MLPLVGSTIVPPGLSRPSRSAASIIRTAMRSFTDPPGFRYSTFARTSGPGSAHDPRRDGTQSDERGVADQAEDGVVYLHPETIAP